jgi:chromosome partitioning protein
VAHVIAVANQKGGVGKTTTVHTLGAALAERGQSILLVDLDPQACLTYSVGLDPESIPRTLHDVLVGRSKAADVLLSVGSLSVIPASIDLAGSEVHLVGKVGREHAVSRALEQVKDSYDVVLVDCPPSLGILTINGLTAADFVVIPLQCETLSHRGVGQLRETVADVRAYTQPDLAVLGAVATMYDGRPRHTREVLADVEQRYALPVLEPMIPRSIRFAEAPATGQSILAHAPTSTGAQAYRELARTITAMLAP